MNNTVRVEHQPVLHQAIIFFKGNPSGVVGWFFPVQAVADLFVMLGLHSLSLRTGLSSGKTAPRRNKSSCGGLGG